MADRSRGRGCSDGHSMAGDVGAEKRERESIRGRAKSQSSADQMGRAMRSGSGPCLGTRTGMSSAQGTGWVRERGQDRPVWRPNAVRMQADGTHAWWGDSRQKLLVVCGVAVRPRWRWDTERNTASEHAKRTERSQGENSLAPSGRETQATSMGEKKCGQADKGEQSR